MADAAERRSKVSILKDILQTIQDKGGSVRPTHILYGANLSHDRLKKYLESLASEGFIIRKGDDGQSFYSLTKKGVEFLGTYYKMNRFFKAFGVGV